MLKELKMKEMIGSTWARWDLHTHTPETQMSDVFKLDEGEPWVEYLKKLEASVVSVFGITDYFSCANYFLVLEKYRKLFPSGTKVFFPNIEIRLTETVNKAAEHIHAHIIFDNNELTCSREKIESFLSRLETHLPDKFGAKVNCLKLTAHQCASATVAFDNVCAALIAVFGNDKPYLIFAAANGDGIRADSGSPRKRTLSDALEQRVDGLFGNAKNTDWFLQTDRYDDPEITSRPKPVFTGSDAHSFDDLERLSGDVPGWAATWVKAETTFRGLMQTIFEPAARVYIGDEPEVRKRQLQEGTRFIKSLSIDQVPGYDGSSNGSWFKNVEIPFNPELTAIIGNKGSGKSAIADILGLCGDSRQEAYFSFLSNNTKNKKFREKGYAENFSATVNWCDGHKSSKRLDSSIETANPERIKYLPQNFFEHLTNEIEVQAFRSQIEEVVFSHVEATSRMDSSSFEELEDLKTSVGRKEISLLKVKLRETNFIIADLEESAKPEKRDALVQELDAKQKEVLSLIASKPEVVTAPDGDDSEQKSLSEAIERLVSLRAKITESEASVTQKISLLKQRRERLSNLYKRLQGLSAYVLDEVQSIYADCKPLAVETEKLIIFALDLDRVTAEGKKVKLDIEKLESTILPNVLSIKIIQDVETLPDLERAKKFLDEAITSIREKLSAPHKRYQSFIESISAINDKIKRIEGDEKDIRSGTIAQIQRDIKKFDNELIASIVEKEKERKDLVRKIFNSKMDVLAFYEELKKSVEVHLEKIRGFDDTFRVTIEASIIQKPEMLENFFDFVDQRKSGSFSAIDKGAAKLSDYSLASDWSSFEGVWSFISNITAEMKKSEAPLDRQLKQNKLVKEFYDYLYSIEYLDIKYELKLGGKSINQLSPGEKGLLLLVFYLHLDLERVPLVIDQPEDNLDNDSIFKVLATCIREAKKNRQVILVTHNPNLAVGADAEQIIYVKLEKHIGNKFSYQSGSIENASINNAIVTILEGSHPAFIKRRLKYGIE